MSAKFDKLQQAFNLPGMEEVSPDTAQEIEAALAQAKDLEQHFDQMDGYDQHDHEMDELAGLAIQAHKDLQDLGMNVEIKHAGEIFSSAGQMLKIAVDAKNLKVEKKLKLLRLQLDKMKIDRAHSPPDAVDGTAVSLDRNEILKQLRQMGGNDK
jgi:hypothetical protein